MIEVVGWLEPTKEQAAAVDTAVDLLDEEEPGRYDEIAEDVHSIRDAVVQAAYSSEPGLERRIKVDENDLEAWKMGLAYLHDLRREDGVEEDVLDQVQQLYHAAKEAYHTNQ